MLKVLQIAGLAFLLQAQVAESGGSVSCDDDVYAHLAGNGEVSYPRTNFIPLDVSFPAIPVLTDSGSVLIATSRMGCGKVTVFGKMTPLYKKGFTTLLTNCINYLTPADSLGTICVLRGLNPRVPSHITDLYSETCFEVVVVNDIVAEMTECAVILTSGATDYSDEEDAAILGAVSDGAGLLVAGKAGVNNDLTESVGITFRKGLDNRVTSRGVDLDLIPPPDPRQCIFRQPDYGDEAPCNITSIGDLAFVPAEGIGAGYYGAGRVAIIGSEPILTDRFESNQFLLRDILAFTSQSKETCNCTMGCFDRCETFEAFSANYTEAFGVMIPVEEITEPCGTCCVALDLRDVGIVDTTALYAHVRGGGCLILTCRDRSDQYDVIAINTFLLPFGFQIGLTG